MGCTNLVSERSPLVRAEVDGDHHGEREGLGLRPEEAWDVDGNYTAGAAEATIGGGRLALVPPDRLQRWGVAIHHQFLLQCTVASAMVAAPGLGSLVRACRSALSSNPG